MKKLLLLVCFLTLPFLLQAQNIRSTLKPSVEIRAGQGIEFYSQPYRSYCELPRTSVLLQADVNIFMFAVGYDYIALRGQGHESAVNVRGGIQIDLGRFSGDTYVSAEKIFQTQEPMPTLFGYGISGAFRLIGPLNIFADIRVQYPLFQRTYSYYQTISTCLSVGIKIKL